MCFSPHRRAIFRQLNFKKCSENVSFCTFWLENVLFATAASNFWFLLWAPTSAPAALTGLLLDCPDTRILEKNTAFRDFSNICRGCIFFLLTFSPVHLFITSDLTACLICFSTLHIVGSLLFKLPSTTHAAIWWLYLTMKRIPTGCLLNKQCNRKEEGFLRGSHVPIKRDHFKRKIHQILTSSSFRWIFFSFQGSFWAQIPQDFAHVLPVATEIEWEPANITAGDHWSRHPAADSQGVSFQRRKPSHLGGSPVGLAAAISTAAQSTAPPSFWLSQKKRGSHFF